MLLKRIQVKEGQRVLVIRNGQISTILRPGNHLFFTLPFTKLRTEVHHLHRLMCRSRWLDRLLSERPDLAAEHLTIVSTDNSQMAMISIEGDLYQVLLPGRRAVFWKDAVNLDVEMINVVESPAISDSMLAALEEGNHQQEAKIDLWSDSGAGTLFDRVLDPESYSESSHGS